MNYEFWFDGKPWDREDIPIGQIFREEWSRPEVGMELKIKGRVFKVTRTVPAGNPDNVKVIYYVEYLNGNWPYKDNK